jgi:hypothetical protein
MMSTQATEEVYDTILVPTLTQVEEARHSDQITNRSAEEVLQRIEELAEELASHPRLSSESDSHPVKRVVCVPARDFADEVACQLAFQTLSDLTTVKVISAESSTSELLQSIESLQPDAICVIGVPPNAIRHLRMRCQQIRTRMPDVIVVACVLSRDSDLSNLRSRILTEDAHHVVYSMQLLKEYLTSLLSPQALQSETRTSQEEVDAEAQLRETIHEMQRTDIFDEPDEGIFGRLATDLARSFDATIALITSVDGQRYFWEAQCGLGEDILSATESSWDLSMCSKIVFYELTLVLPDTIDDECFANDRFLKDKGVRFYAGAPLKTQNGEVIGSLCALDTRPRTITDQQKEQLISTANAVMTAIELHVLENSTA